MTALLVLGLLPLRLAAQADTTAVQLDSSVVRVGRHTSALSGGDRLKVEVSALRALPSLAGSADPVRFLRNLPGVATGCEYDAGLHIQGCENGHNIVSLSGVPVYSATHILGLFSVFHPDHFPSMAFDTHAPSDNRLGGQVDLEPSFERPEKLSGAVSLGLFVAQGMLRTPLTGNSSLTASARRSYLNLLYSPFLVVEKDPFRYGFHDVNLSWVWQPSSRDRVWANAYYGADKLSYTSAPYHLDIGLHWWNALGSLHWQHKGPEAEWTQSVFATLFQLDMDLNHDYMMGKVPSYMRTYGYKGQLKWKDFHFGADVLLHHALPQQVHVIQGNNRSSELQQPQWALEATLRGRWQKTLGPWELEAALAGIYYLSPERKSQGFLSPSAGVGFNMYRAGKVTLRGGAARQHLIQTGLTSLGFPVEFWFLAGKEARPQTSAWLSLAYKVQTPDEGYAFSAEVYGKRLWNQVEYIGTLLDFLSASYRLSDMIIPADGVNCGISLMVHKQTGPFTGWVGYTLGRSLRYTEREGVFPSVHERIHELNVVALYSARRWDAGGTFVAASGTPFTAPETMYLTGGQIICQWGPHNGARLASYIRLDLNFNWYFRRDERVTHGLSVCLYNALGRDNQIAYKLFTEDDAFAFAPFGFGIRFMPSLGWFYRF